jgi:hypothetical protein
MGPHADAMVTRDWKIPIAADAAPWGSRRATPDFVGAPGDAGDGYRAP